MIYYLNATIFISILIGIWYNWSLEDELSRNKNLSDKDKSYIEGLILKGAKSQLFFPKNMFQRHCWNINSRVRKCLTVYLLMTVHIYAVAILYFTVFD